MPRWRPGSEPVLLDTRLQTETRMEELLDCASRSRLTALGEVHNNPLIVWVAAEILRAAASRGRVVLAVEYFNTEQQSLLDAWLDGRITWEALVDEYSRGPEGFPLETYRPLLEAARSLGVRIIGVMPPRTWANTLARGGRPPRMPRGPVDPSLYPGYRGFLEPLFPRRGPMARIPVERLLEAQSYKDQWAAETVAQALHEAGVVLVMGWAHIEAPWGVPERAAGLAGVPGWMTCIAGSRLAGSLEELRAVLRGYGGRARSIVLAPRVDGG